jgi:hypothetical protein
MNELLIDMLRFGEPMVFISGERWLCNIKMTVNSEFVKIDVKGYGSTPELSVIECNKNMKEAMQTLTTAHKLL